MQQRKSNFMNEIVEKGKLWNVKLSLQNVCKYQQNSMQEKEILWLKCLRIFDCYIMKVNIVFCSLRNFLPLTVELFNKTLKNKAWSQFNQCYSLADSSSNSLSLLVSNKEGKSNSLMETFVAPLLFRYFLRSFCSSHLSSALNHKLIIRWQ